jgi:hypothetical protein
MSEILWDKLQEIYKYMKGSIGIGGILVSMWDMETEKKFLMRKERTDTNIYIPAATERRACEIFSKIFPFSTRESLVYNW